jgi:hypothetical protein
VVNGEEHQCANHDESNQTHLKLAKGEWLDQYEWPPEQRRTAFGFEAEHSIGKTESPMT